MVERLDYTRLDLASHPERRRVIKESVPVRVEFAEKDEQIATREGIVCCTAGDALLTGAEGEQWPVRRSIFSHRYEAIAPTRPGEAGWYCKKPMPVWAIRLRAPVVLLCPSGGTLSGAAGDWLVQFDARDFGIVAATIFAATYRILPEEDAP